MSAEIVKIYRQEVPALRFIGKTYTDGDRVNGNFGKLWEEWFRNSWFDEIQSRIDGNSRPLFEDSGANIGLMRWKDGEPFEYRIGLFTPAGTPVPAGYGYVDFPPSVLGVCWVYGKAGDVFMQEENCMKKLEAQGFTIAADPKNARWFFERYSCPRFTEQDAEGNIILDICWHLA